MISKPEIIALAACPSCGAYRGEQCRLTTAEDRHGHRRAAMQSHLPRMQIARKRHAELNKPIDLSAIII